MRALAGLGAAVALALGAVPAVAQTPPEAPFDVRIERDFGASGAINELSVSHTVTITDKATGAPPTVGYEVYGGASNDAGEQTEDFACEELSANDPSVPRGVYFCPIFVDHGGKWTFTTTVLELRGPRPGELGEDTDAPPVVLARASAPFELETSQVYTGDPGEEIKGSASEVAWLWGHILVASAWFALVGGLALLAVPALRLRLSPHSINRLEWRLDLLVKSTWGVTAALTATGTYLWLNETAYDAPWSSSAIDGVFALPYGKPYFLSLWTKVGLYALMALAVIPLVRGARRQLSLGSGMSAVGAASPASAGRPASPGRAPDGSVLTEAPPEAEAVGVDRRSPVGPRLAVVVVAAGALGISLCVTLLKYFHQLIEAGFAQAAS
ncbi:MAG: hypothetical protein ACRDY7_09135 [Acidimicrobiia bacterium]